MRTSLAPPVRAFVLLAALLPASLEAQTAPMPEVPAALAVPSGRLVGSVSAAGTQVYECARTPKGDFAWSFREPKADLTYNGKAVGRHFAGPTWEFTDGTRVVGRVSAKTDGKGPDDIPWLKLDVIRRVKTGPAAGAKYVLRMDTQGGNLAGPCTNATTFREVPYKATYLFVK